MVAAATEMPRIRLLLACCLLATCITVYFCWEVLYQERVIVSILSHEQGEAKKSYLHEWILDKYQSREDSPVLVARESDIRRGELLLLNIGEDHVTRVNDDQLFQMVQEIGVQENKTVQTGSKLQIMCELCVVYDVTKMVYGSYDCVELAVKPPVKVCVYPPQMDNLISKQILSTGMWEPGIVNTFQKLLSHDGGLGVIDVGANLGLYSLIAASRGHPVLAIEPYLENIWHMHRAVRLQNLHNITILHNAVSEQEGTAWLVLNAQNQGDIRVNTDRNTDQGTDHTVPVRLQINTVTMDKLLPYIPFSRAILKLDIQGYEHKAFAQASQLLKRIYIPYIFMEWVFMREFHQIQHKEPSADEVLVWRMLDLLKKQGYTPFSATGHQQLDFSAWPYWPDDVLWVQELAELLV